MMKIVRYIKSKIVLVILYIAYQIISFFGSGIKLNKNMMTTIIADVISENRSSNQDEDWFTAEKIVAAIEQETKRILDADLKK